MRHHLACLLFFRLAFLSGLASLSSLFTWRLPTILMAYSMVTNLPWMRSLLSAIFFLFLLTIFFAKLLLCFFAQYFLIFRYLIYAAAWASWFCSCLPPPPLRSPLSTTIIPRRGGGSITLLGGVSAERSSSDGVSRSTVGHASGGSLKCSCMHGFACKGAKSGGLHALNLGVTGLLDEFGLRC